MYSLVDCHAYFRKLFWYHIGSMRDQFFLWLILNVYLALTGVQDCQKLGGSSPRKQPCCWGQKKMLKCEVRQIQNDQVLCGSGARAEAAVPHGAWLLSPNLPTFGLGLFIRDTRDYRETIVWFLSCWKGSTILTSTLLESWEAIGFTPHTHLFQDMNIMCVCVCALWYITNDFVYFSQVRFSSIKLFFLFKIVTYQSTFNMIYHLYFISKMLKCYEFQSQHVWHTNECENFWLNLSVLVSSLFCG